MIPRWYKILHRKDNSQSVTSKEQLLLNWLVLRNIWYVLVLESNFLKEVNIKVQNSVKQVIDDAARVHFAFRQASKQAKKSTGLFGTKKKSPPGPAFAWNPDVPIDKDDIKKMEQVVVLLLF